MVQEYPNPLPWRFTAMQRADGKWCVFVAHNDSPEWYRLIAEFSSKDRAESYVCIENDIAEEGDPAHHDDISVAPIAVLPASPVNRVTPERLTVRTTMERHEVEVTRESVPAVVGPHLRISPALTARMTEPAPKPPKVGHVGLPEGEHGRRRGAILQAIKDHVSENNEFPSQQQISRRSGVTMGSLATYLAQLEQQGELAKNAAGLRYLKTHPNITAKPQYGEQARAAATLQKSDEEMVAEHLATKGVTKLPPAELAETTASLKSKFTHVIEPKGGRPTEASKAAGAIADYQRGRA